MGNVVSWMQKCDESTSAFVIALQNKKIPKFITDIPASPISIYQSQFVLKVVSNLPRGEPTW